jgi:TM2 domain-containing membrane protein YozV
VRLATGGEGKEWLTALLLCIFLGYLGIHRFYTGHTAIGIVQLVTLGGCGIWTLIDLIMIATGSYKDKNGNPLIKK